MMYLCALGQLFITVETSVRSVLILLEKLLLCKILFGP